MEGILLCPIPHIAVSANHEFNNLQNLGALESNLYNKFDHHRELVFALNPKLQLTAFYQYNSFDKTGRVNVRGSWKYRPLSFIYLVFNDTQTDLFKMLAMLSNNFILAN